MAFSVVQSVFALGTGNPTLTLSTVAAGNTIVAFALIGTGTGDAVTAVADSQGSYTQWVGLTATATNLGAYAYGLANTTSGTHAATFTTTVGGAWGACGLLEVSGADPAAPFDVGAALFVANGSYTATTDGLHFGAATTTSNGDFILTCMSPTGTNDQATAGTGYTIVVNSTASAVSNHTYVQTQTQATAGSTTPTISPSGTGDGWGTVWVALKAVNNNKTITASSGTYSYTGQSTTLAAGATFTLSAGFGGYSISGSNATLSSGVGNFILVASPANYSYVGGLANSDQQIDAAFGSYGISGQSVIMTTGTNGFAINAAFGSYSILGQTTNLLGPSVAGSARFLALLGVGS